MNTMVVADTMEVATSAAHRAATAASKATASHSS